jgi:hypothetical protein
MKPATNFWNLVFGICVLLFVAACTSNEIGNSKDVAQDKIYQEYTLLYNEGDETVIASAVFRFAGINGTTLVLNEPAKIELDNEELKVDSNHFRGAYYEVSKVSSQWMRKHEWEFTDINGKVFSNEFSFDEFGWDNIPAAVSKKQDLPLNFKTTELGAGDYIEISTVDNDSSFTITQQKFVKPFTVIIPAAQLQRQKTSSIKIEASRVQKIKLQQLTSEGGDFTIRYSLKPISIHLK